MQNNNSQNEEMVSVKNIGKMYKLYDKPVDRLKDSLWGRFGKNYGREFWALNQISIDVTKGQTVGILGRNGSGKSTLLQIIAGVLQPTHGEIKINGRVSALLELGSGFNPEFTGKENVFMSGAVLGFSKQEMENLYDEIIRFADIGQFVDQPVKAYSSGMMMRLAFAVASCVQPDILIVDEALAVGDVLFQAKCFEKIKNLRKQGTTTLFVTHDVGTFQNLCDYGYILENGSIFAEGTPPKVALQYYELMRVSEHARQKLELLLESENDQNIIENQKKDIDKQINDKKNDIKDKDNKDEYRFGTSSAIIKDCFILNKYDQQVDSVLVGDIFAVVVTIKIIEKVQNLTFGVMLRNPQGQNLMGSHTYHENRLSLGIYKPGETLQIRCEQEMLLNPGQYVMTIGIADHKSDFEFISLDSRNNFMKVSVYGHAEVYYGLVHTRPNFTFSLIQEIGE